MNKDFRGELDYFHQKIKDRVNFCISRFNDGEQILLRGESWGKPGKTDFQYVPENPDHQKSRSLLTTAFKASLPEYYTGIPCRCCVGETEFQRCRKDSGKPDEELTWGNIFVNGNYWHFMKNVAPSFSELDVYVVAREGAVVENLPFAVRNYWTVGENAWIKDLELIERISKYIRGNNIQNAIFALFCGPLANIMSYQLFKEFPNNTYLDLGSVYDVTMGLGASRGYLRGASTLEKVCIW